MRKNQRNKAIPVAVMGLLIALVAVLAVFTLDDELALLRNSTIETPEITLCAINAFDLGKEGVGDVDQQFAAQAVLESGHVVTGAFIHPTQKLCEKRLYRTVSVRVHTSDVSLSRMDTFFDFWLVPFLFGVVLLVLVFLALKENSDSKLFRFGGHAVMVAAVLIILVNYWNDYETARNFELLGLERKPVEAEGESL